MPKTLSESLNTSYFWKYPRSFLLTHQLKTHSWPVNELHLQSHCESVFCRTKCPLCTQKARFYHPPCGKSCHPLLKTNNNRAAKKLWSIRKQGIIHVCKWCETSCATKYKSFGIKVLLKSVTVSMSNNKSDACFSKVGADECLWEKT